MSELENWQIHELEQFKMKSKEAYLNSFSNSLSFFNFAQWLDCSFDTPEEKKAARDKVFSTWSKQVMSATAPILAGINKELNQPKNRWLGMIEEKALSTEDYAKAVADSLKEIKEQFYKSV